jgi:predicted MFS family arabinose efflux permease
MRAVARAGIRHGWDQQPLRLLMLAGFVQTGFFMWAFYAWQPYFLELLADDAVWVAGVVSALIAGSMMAGNGLVEWFTRFCGRRTTLLLWAAGVQSLAAVVVGLADTFWLALPALLLITGGMGVAGPIRQSYFHHLVPSGQRATVVSFDSMVAGVGGIGGQLGLGAIAQNRSISAGYVVGGLVAGLAWPVLWAVRRLDSPADVIVGSEAPAGGTCAAQGIPAISAVDDGVPAEAR